MSRPRLLCPILAAAVVLSAGVAQAQDEELVPPRILVIFDTSGSMAWKLDVNESAGGDGSREFPTHEETRIYAAKEALRAVLLSIGQHEAEFGLMRYSQTEGLRVNRFPEEYDRPINYRGTCDPGGDVLVPFGESNLAQLVSWIDHEEQWPGNKELRADGATPLAGALQEAQRWLRQEVLPNDINADCRIYSIILLTDGAETCPDAPVACEVIDGLKAVPNGHDDGVTEVTTYTVGFGPLEGRQEIALDDMAECAGVNGNVAFRAEDRQDLQLAFGLIIGLALPIEVCDDRDNDCDGLVDEGVRNSCGLCGPDPEELCNGLDDDCDGEVDEGVRNSCGECGPQPFEECNGEDDDCDGLVDEPNEDTPGVDPCRGCTWRAETCDGEDNDCDQVIDNDVSLSCGTDVGECEFGARACQGGVFVELCDGGVQPVDEECDTLDNDCDGITDGHSRTCGEGLGECASGRQICVGGAWGDCLGAKDPANEVCNSKDDDCDGEIDEGVRNSCNECGPSPVEVCDGDDDDCDDRIDDGAQCPEGFSCVQGECTRPCFHGECPLGQRCLEDICVSDPCRIARCKAGDVCDPQAGACVDPCEAMDCPADQACDLGECVPEDCRHLGCPPGEICRDGACETHPCADAGCGQGQYCRDGACVGACDGVSCDAGLRCVEGECVPVTCEDAQCPPGQACVRGECAQDPCGGVACSVATECLDGVCVDPPCRFVVCPADNSCEKGVCIPNFVGDPCLGPNPPEDGCGRGCEVEGCPPGEECEAGQCVPITAEGEGEIPREGEGEGESGVEGDGDGGDEGCGCDPVGGEGWMPPIAPRR